MVRKSASWNDNSEVQSTIDGALARIQKRGRVAGTIASNETVAKYAAAGVRFFLTYTAPWLSTGAKGFISRSKEAKRSA